MGLGPQSFSETKFPQGRVALEYSGGCVADQTLQTPHKREFEGVLKEAGIEFIEENGGGPGERLEKKKI